MEWYNVLTLVLGAFGGVGGFVALYKAKPEKTSIEVQNMKEMLGEAHKMFDKMKEEKEAEHNEFEEYKKNNMAYVAEFKERFQKVEDRLDKAERFVFTLKSVIYRGYRCPYPPSVDDCPIIKAYKGEACEDCGASLEK